MYEVKGPLGKGLNIQTDGEHIAFAAGTGVLVFIDLVAHLILRILVEKENLTLGEFTEPKLNLSQFKLVLYTSFANDKEAIGLPLIEALKTLCEKHDYPSLFTHNSRISSQPSGKQRWTQQFFTEKVKEAKAAGAKNLWVCGPPLMQEQCDKALYEMEPEDKAFVHLM